jgi:hypothetical protein
MNLHATAAIAKQQRQNKQQQKEAAARQSGRSPLSVIVTQAQKETHEIWSTRIQQLSAHTIEGVQNPDGSFPFLIGMDAPPTPYP